MRTEKDSHQPSAISPQHPLIGKPPAPSKYQNAVQPAKSRTRFLRRFLLALTALYVAGTVLGGIGLGWIAFHPPSPRITDSEERNARATGEQAHIDFRDVELKAADGVTLRAWFLRPPDASGAAVILLHGVSDNRMGMYGYGRWLVQNRYSVLLPDARAHGNSEGLASYGLKESDDIHRWIDWIETNEHPSCVYGLGESMGAAQLLQSLPGERSTQVLGSAGRFSIPPSTSASSMPASNTGSTWRKPLPPTLSRRFGRRCS